MKKKIESKKDTIEIKNIPVSGSLGLLALGDIAFKQWRQVKMENNIFKRENEERKENQ